MTEITFSQDDSPANVEDPQRCTPDIQSTIITPPEPQQPEPVVETSTQLEIPPTIASPILPREANTSQADTPAVASRPTDRVKNRSGISVPVDSTKKYYWHSQQSSDSDNIRCMPNPRAPSPLETAVKTPNPYSMEYMGRGRPGNPLKRPPVQANMRPTFKRGEPSGTQDIHNHPNLELLYDGETPNTVQVSMENDIYVNEKGVQLFEAPSVIEYLNDLEHGHRQYCKELETTLAACLKELLRLRERSDDSGNISSDGGVGDSDIDDYLSDRLPFEEEGRWGSWYGPDRGRVPRQESPSAWIPDQIWKNFVDPQNGLGDSSDDHPEDGWNGGSSYGCHYH